MAVDKNKIYDAAMTELEHFTQRNYLRLSAHVVAGASTALSILNQAARSEMSREQLDDLVTKSRIHLERTLDPNGRGVFNND